MNYRRLFIILGALSLIAIAVVYIVFIWFGDGPPPPKVPVVPAATFAERKFPFRNEKDLDRFLIGYQGQDILKAEMQFYVVSNDRDTLYRLRFPSSELIPSDSIASLPDSARAKWLMNRMAGWVEEAGKPVNAADILSIAEAAQCAAPSRLLRLFSEAHLICWSAEKGSVMETTLVQADANEQ